MITEDKIRRTVRQVLKEAMVVPLKDPELNSHFDYWEEDVDDHAQGAYVRKTMKKGNLDNFECLANALPEKGYSANKTNNLAFARYGARVQTNPLYRKYWEKGYETLVNDKRRGV